MRTDYFKLAIKNLGKRKVRSWLTVLGIVISVAIIFVLISLSVGLREAINEQFQVLGTDKFFVLPKGQAGAPGSGGAVELTTADVNVIAKIPGVKDYTYVTAANAKVEFSGKIRYFMVVGIPLDRMKIFTESVSLKMDEGKMLQENEKGKVMLGYDYKYNNVFSKPVKTGDNLLINGKEFRVAGIISKVGNPSDDKNIIMDIEDMKEFFNTGDRVDEIIVQAQGNVEELANKTERRLIQSRGVTEKTKDFTISTPQELLSSFDTILNIITAFLVGVASISLLVGSIGIANTMYTSVLERTKEIGTMKAVGAKNSDVLWIFLIESGLLGAVGGFIGMSLGLGISKLVELIAIQSLGTDLLRAATPYWLVIGCVLFGFIIGSVSGGLPAYQASRLKPVDALRYE